MKKGFEKTPELIIGLLLLVIVAFVIAMFIKSNVSETSESTAGSIEKSGSAANDVLCKGKCDLCKQLGGGNCDWDSFDNSGSCADYACS